MRNGAVAVLAGFLAGCGQPAGPSSRVVVDVNPPEILLTTPGQRAQLYVSVTDLVGYPLGDPAGTWSSADAAIASVDSLAVVTARGEGVTWIRYTQDAASDSARIIVRLD